MGILEDNNTFTDPTKYGYRVYQLIKDGPLAKANIKELSDFIIPPEEVQTKKTSFADWVKSFAGKTIKIKVYSLLLRDFKEVEITTNEEGAKSGILGAAVRLENYTTADKNLLHVTSVLKNSFSDLKLGLIPKEDYIIAVKTKFSPIISLNKEEFNPLEILNTIIKQNKGTEITMYIYNSKNGQRIVDFIIESGDDFTLGCDVAYGYIHEFPILNNDKETEKENQQKDIEKKGGIIEDKII